MRNTWLLIAFKSVKLLKIFKSVKAFKAIWSFLSMAICAICYSGALGWTFAIGLVAMLFIHEMGHTLALKQKGFGVKLPTFIPFIGAVIFAPKIKNRHVEAYVGYAGPLLGTIASFLVLIQFQLDGRKIWALIGYTGLILNLFNMIPISPLDGGRITQAIHRHFQILGLGALAVLTALIGEPGMLLIWMAVTMDLKMIRVKPRMITVMSIWAVMFILTSFGFGENQTANWWDVAIGSLMTVPILINVMNKEIFSDLENQVMEEEREEARSRKELKSKLKLQWLLFWLGLIAIQVLGVIWITHFLRKTL